MRSSGATDVYRAAELTGPYLVGMTLRLRRPLVGRFDMPLEDNQAHFALELRCVACGGGAELMLNAGGVATRGQQG